MFSVTYLNETRIVAQFFFQGWPDFGVPESTCSIRKLVYMLEEYQKLTDPLRPTLIHCSAGIGRTGTFLAIHIALDVIQKETSKNQSFDAPEGSSLECSSTLEYDENEVIDERHALSSGSQGEDGLSSGMSLSEGTESSGFSGFMEEVDDEISSACSIIEETCMRSDDEEDDEDSESFQFVDIIKNKKIPPIKDIVISLRKQRNRGMVQTEEQYKFIYRSVLDEIKGEKTTIPKKVYQFLKERTQTRRNGENDKEMEKAIYFN